MKGLSRGGAVNIANRLNTMMNPPERLGDAFEVVLQLNTSWTLATILSCKNVLDKTNSLSSGVLADHSGLSEISEPCNDTPTFALPRISRSEDHLSTSTSSSSGLSVSHTQPKVPVRSKPCFSRVKIICNCGKPGCDQPLPVKLSNGNDKTPDLRENHDAPLHIDNPIHSDMDLTDPLGQTADETELPPQIDVQPDEPPTLSQESFPKIRLSLRPRCLTEDPQTLSLQRVEGPSCASEPLPLKIRINPLLAMDVARLAKDDMVDSADDDDDSEMPQLWDWRRNLLDLFCFPEKLPESERGPEIPSHYIEDPNSILFGMIWLINTEFARLKLEPPPSLTRRIFYDPSMITEFDYPWPQYVLDSLKGMTEDQRQALYDDFVRVREIAFARNPHLKRTSGTDMYSRQEEEEEEDEEEECVPESPIQTYELSSEDEVYERHEDVQHRDVVQLEEVDQEEDIDLTNECGDLDNEPQPRHSPPAQPQQAPPAQPQDSPPAQPQHSPLALPRHSPPAQPRDSPPAKRARVDSPPAVPVSAHSECPHPGVLLVYARCDKWYYPGTLKCSLDEWNGAIKPLRVLYYDSQEKDLPPDQIFPMVRLPPGASIQRQIGDSIYEDVFFLSSTFSFASGLPSARLLVQDPDSGTTADVTFENTALSPKDVIRLRSALKDQFYPSRIRQNFTELTEGAILFTSSRRSRTQNAEVKTQASKTSKTTHKANGNQGKGKQSAAVNTETPEVEKSSVSAAGKSAGGKKRQPAKPQPAKPQPVPEKTPEHSSAKQKRQPAKAQPVPKKMPEHSSEKQTQKKTTSEIDKRIKACTQYRCTEKTCLKLFPSSAALAKHRKMTSRSRRRHSGQAIVFRCDVPDCSTISLSREQFRKHLAIHSSPSQPSQPSTWSPMVTQTFAKPSSSGLTPGRNFRASSDTDTDTSQPWQKYSRPSGQGLQDELVVLGETAKSFTGLKSSRKNEATTDIFKGLHFVMTKGVVNKGSHTTKRSRADSESDSTDFENYYHTNVKFDVAALQRVIEIGGGKVHENLTDVPTDALQTRDPSKPSVILVSNHPCTTPNYIHAVALGLTLLRHDTILECAKKGISLQSMLKAGSANLLSPGWDRQRQMWVPPRASRVTPLSNLTLMSVLTDHQYWHQLVRLMGGRSIEWLSFIISSTSGVFAILADQSIGEQKRSMAAVRRLPVVTTEWLVQAVITGSKPPVYNYELPSPPSTS